MFRLPAAACFLAIACAAIAQTPDPNLTFDVATIKIAEPPKPVMVRDGGNRISMRTGPSGGPGTGDPGQVNYSFMNLHQLIALAYGVKSYQVTGPSTIDSDRYDITAKVPKGASKEDVKVMLQNLLKDRMGLKFHRATKETGVYALVVAKNGPKLTESEDQSDPSDALPAAPSKHGGPNALTAGPPPPPDPSKTVKMGPDGMPTGAMLRPGGIAAMMRMGPDGARMKLAGKQVLLSQLADTLSGQLDKPCVDMTGLTKRYDLTLDFAPDMGAMQAKGGMMMLGGPPKGAGAEPGRAEPDPSTDSASLFTALSEQLGLKLEQKKAPVDLITVDAANKVPTEN